MASYIETIVSAAPATRVAPSTDGRHHGILLLAVAPIAKTLGCGILPRLGASRQACGEYL
jgi:hypothetical protein